MAIYIETYDSLSARNSGQVSLKKDYSDRSKVVRTVEEFETKTFELQHSTPRVWLAFFIINESATDKLMASDLVNYQQAKAHLETADNKPEKQASPYDALKEAKQFRQQRR